MKHILKTLTATAVFMAVLQATAHAQIVSYDVVAADDAPTDSVTPTQTLANSVAAPASDLTVAAGLNSGYYAYGYSFGPNTNAYPDSLAGAVSDNGYVTFTVTPQTGISLDLTSLDLSGASFENNSGGDTTYFAVESSVGGFSGTSALATPTAFSSTTAGPDITLGSAYSDLTTATEFRLYFYQDEGAESYIDDTIENGSTIVLNGTANVAILNTPEPSTYALLGLGAAALILVSRRRNLV